MPQNLDYNLYFNLVFLAVIGIGFIVGYFRGFRKTMFGLVALVLFYVIFFTTIDLVINVLWDLPIPFLIDFAVPYVPELSTASTMGDAVFTMLNSQFGDQISSSLTNVIVVDFVTGLAQLVVKIVYTILYFTIGKLFYNILAWMIRIIFFTPKTPKQLAKRAKKKNKGKTAVAVAEEVEVLTKKQKKIRLAAMKKEEQKALRKAEKKAKKKWLGALAGAGKGFVNAFAAVIIFGGMLSFVDSALSVIPEDTTTFTAVELPSDLDSTITESRSMLAAFNSNIYVKTVSVVKVDNPDYTGKIPLHLYLFDSVLSFKFQDTNVSLREEFNVVANAGSALMNSQYMVTDDLSDITSDEVETIFTNIAESNLVTLAIPVVIEIGSEYFDTPVEVPIDELYAINWKEEIQTLGTIAAIGFDLVNTAGLLDDATDLETVTLNGDDVASIFDSLGESDLATLGAFVAIEPLLEQAGSDISAIITVPTDLVWEDEFSAFGQVAKAVLDTNITMADLQSNDTGILINALSELDFTVLLQSQIVSHALKNIFSGEAGIEGLDIIVVPDGVVWFDVYNGDVLETPGELRNILTAVNAIASVAGGFDFNNIDFTVISEFDDDAINAIFYSELLVASISDFIMSMDLGDTPLVIPDSVLDVNNYISSDELKNIASSAKVLVNDLACDEGDTVCEETGFDMAKAFSLTDTSIDILTSSDILGATLGQLIIDNGVDILTIPNSALDTIYVSSVPQDVVSKEEIKSMFQAVSVLGFTDIENMEFDATIIQNLGLDSDVTILDPAKSAKLFGSKIVHATLSTMLLEQTVGPNSPLSVPYFGDDLRVIRSSIDGVEYLSEGELDDILQAFLTLNITDFETVDTLDLNLIITNSGTLLESAILHATISKQVFDLGTDVIMVPYQDELGNDIRITVGDPAELEETTYIDKAEITNILDALEVLNITDINSFDGNIDIASITSEPGNITKMLASATIQATISDQLITLDTDGTIDLPYFKDDLTPIRITVGPVGFETEYVIKDEIEAMVDAMDVLGMSDIENFGGTVDLSTLATGTNATIVLSSATIHATVSKQVLDLTSSGSLTAAFVVPHFDQSDSSIRINVGDVLDSTDTEYIIKAELEAMIDGLDILGITDVETFDGSVALTDFYDETNRNVLLSSSIMQATVSKQLTDLGDSTLRIPQTDRLSNPVRINVGDALQFTDTEYVSKAEIGAMFEALEVLNITDINSFSGTIDLNNIYLDTNQDILLESAAMHATITKQMTDLGSGTLYIPDTDVLGAPIRITISGTEFIEKTEIKATIEALEVLNITDINSFDGTVSLTSIATTPEQDILLSSASIHATVTNTLLDLNDDVLIIPAFDQNGETVGNEIKVTVSGFEFVVKDEIKALINAFTAMGYSDINNFPPSIGSADFFAGRDTLLLSSSIQATVSNKMLNDTGGELIVPDVNVNNANVIRIVQTDVTYIELIEIDAIFDALEEMGLTDFTSLDFSPAQILTADFDLILLSASIQATISDNVLAGAVDETAPDGQTNIVIPTYFRDDILVNTVTMKHIEKIELKAILTSLNTIGVTDFNAAINSTTITNLTDPQLDTLLLSGSIHTTIDNMMRGNGALAIPTVAEQTELYKADLVIKQEIKDFIRATKTAFPGSSFTTVNFSPATLVGMSVSDQEIVATSLIVRNILTPTLELAASNPFDSYPLTAADYENNDVLSGVLIRATLLAVVNYYY